MSFDKDRTIKLAEKYIQQGKLLAAVDEYKNILKADPRDLNIINTLGDLYTKLGQNEEAIASFLQIATAYRGLNQINSAIAVYKKILKIDPFNVEVLLILADLYNGLGFNSEAKKQYVSVAEIYKRNGQIRQAIKVKEKITKIDPENASLLSEIAAGYSEEGLIAEACEYYVQAGREFLHKGNEAEATQAFRKALAADSTYKPALRALIELLIRQGEIKSALGMIDHLLRDSPQDIDLIMLLGRTYLSANMIEPAEASFTKLFNIDPYRYDYLLDISRIFIENRQFDRAVAIVERCLGSLLKQNQKKKATAILKNIIKADNQNLTALRQLANIYKKTGEKRNLITTLNMIVEVALNLGLHQEAIDMLKELIEVEPQRRSHQEQLEKLSSTSNNSNVQEVQSFPTGFESFSSGEQSVFQSDTSNVHEIDLQVVPVFSEDSNEYSAELLENIVAGDPQYSAARLKLLEELVEQTPTYIEARLKLKQLYVENGLVEKAAAQCLDIARLYENEGNIDLAKEQFSEAYELNPSSRNLIIQVAKTQVETGLVSSIMEWGGELNSEDISIEVALALMGIANRRQFDRALNVEWRRAARNLVHLSLITINIDYFKAYREEHGNLNGDKHLKQIAGVINKELKRPADLLALYGVDEFVVIMPETSAAGANIVAERMRSSVENLKIPNPNSPKGYITISLGIASVVPQLKVPDTTLISAAELALYRAKRAGGDLISKE